MEPVQFAFIPLAEEDISRLAQTQNALREWAERAKCDIAASRRRSASQIRNCRKALRIQYARRLKRSSQELRNEYDEKFEIEARKLSARCRSDALTLAHESITKLIGQLPDGMGEIIANQIDALLSRYGRTDATARAVPLELEVAPLLKTSAAIGRLCQKHSISSKGGYHSAPYDASLVFPSGKLHFSLKGEIAHALATCSESRRASESFRVGAA